MICDDDQGILDMLQRVPESDGLDVVTVSNSLGLLEVVREEKPDLQLLDLWIPVLPGALVRKRLREQDDRGRLPVLVISASQDGKPIALTYGADDFPAKPFDLDGLTARAHQLLGYQSAPA